MSRQHKMRNKRKHYVKHAKLVGNKVEATGSRGGRTQRVHRKQQVYPKKSLAGKSASAGG